MWSKRQRTKDRRETTGRALKVCIRAFVVRGAQPCGTPNAQTEAVGQGEVGQKSSAWLERVAVGAVLGALGCGDPFMGLAGPDDTDAGDASISDASRDDSFDEASSSDRRDAATRDAAGAADTGSAPVDSGDGALDATGMREGGRDAQPQGDADGAVDVPPPPGGPCPAVCNGGCAAGICTIACSGEQECKGATLECPPGFACEVNCVGKRSCDASLVVCSEADACALLCVGEQSCKKVELICRSGTCDIECLGSSQTCEMAVVNCGQQACTAKCQSPESRPTLNCGQSCDCRPCP